ncbi:MAG: hypothetical protein V1495_10305 [Pseudomonadota bacterium]
MNKFQLLGGISIAILTLALGLAVYILTGQHPKKRVYLVSGTVTILILVESVIAWVIYSEYS